jgi:hypothetical protein
LGLAVVDWALLGAVWLTEPLVVWGKSWKSLSITSAIGPGFEFSKSEPWAWQLFQDSSQAGS